MIGQIFGERRGTGCWTGSSRAAETDSRRPSGRCRYRICGAAVRNGGSAASARAHWGSCAGSWAGRSVSPAIPHPAEAPEPELVCANASGSGLGRVRIGGPAATDRQPTVAPRSPLRRHPARQSGQRVHRSDAVHQRQPAPLRPWRPLRLGGSTLRSSKTWPMVRRGREEGAPKDPLLFTSARTEPGLSW